MADYGVAADTWQPLDWAWAAERLIRPRNYWLTTASGAGVPAALPVWGAWDDDRLRFAFGCSPQSRKARHIAANPNVVVTTEDTIEAVSVHGLATLLGPAAVDAWLDQFVAKYGHEVGPEYADFMRSHPMFEVAPTTAYGVIERVPEFNTRATRWRF